MGIDESVPSSVDMELSAIQGGAMGFGLQAPSIISTEKCVDPLDSMDIGRKGG
jgi:hypothetical protein